MNVDINYSAILEKMSTSNLLMSNILSTSDQNILENCETASVAWMAGYIVRTIEERISGCSECLTDISTPASSNKLLDLIYLHDKGSLRYPSKPFVSLISAIKEFIVNLLPLLHTYASPLSIICKILRNPISASDCFKCGEHKLILADTILEKLGKPILHNIGDKLLGILTY